MINEHDVKEFGHRGAEFLHMSDLLCQCGAGNSGLWFTLRYKGHGPWPEKPRSDIDDVFRMIHKGNTEELVDYVRGMTAKERRPEGDEYWAKVVRWLQGKSVKQLPSDTGKHGIQTKGHFGPVKTVVRSKLLLL